MPDTDASKLDVARRLIQAIEAGDVATVASLYADDMVGWRSFDQKELPKKSMVRVIEFLVKHVRDVHYTNLRVEPTPTGYVEQHVLNATAPDGTKVVAPACLVVQVENGQIRRLDEYLDAATIAPLMKR
jgi:ketosteroid isomerase-like protein